MKPEIQINHLKTLIAIDEEGSFGAAAKRVGRTQSAVTQQMQSLDQILCTPLIVANGRNKELTDAGQALLRHAREIISMCNYAIASSSRKQQTDVIKIGTPHEVAEDFLHGPLVAFAKLRPQTRIVIQVDRSPILMQALEEGRLNMILSTRRSENYDSVLLANLPVHWIAAVDWQPEPNAPWPLILTDEPSLYRRVALAALDVYGHDYVEKLTSPSLAGVRLAVAAGLGITARTESSFHHDIKVLSKKSGLPSLPEISYYLHRPADQATPSSNDLFQMIIEHAEKYS